MRSRRRRHLILICLILLASAAVYLVGNRSVPLWDRDEPRYAQTSRQMLDSGDWVVPRFLDRVRTAKPVFIYWCQAGAMSVLGDNAFAARLPSAVAMPLALVAFASILWTNIGARRTTLAVLILATSGLSIAAAKLCVTDAVLLLWVTIAQVCLFRALGGRDRWSLWLAMGVAVGLAVLTKGPVVFGVMGATCAALFALRWIDRKKRDVGVRLTRPYKALVAIVVATLVCAPWLVLIHRREPGFLPAIIGHDVIERMKSPLEGHSGPPGYYLLTIWGTFFPWSLFLPAAIVYGWKRRADSLTRFALASVVGPWVMFEIVQTKLVHYMLPVFPWLAVLTARAITGLRGQAAGLSWVVGAWAILVATMGFVPLLATWRWMQSVPPRASVTALAFAAAATAYAAAVFLTIHRRRIETSAVVLGTGMLVLIAILYGGFLPAVDELRVGQKLARILHDEGATSAGDVVMIDYKEPSLAFYQGGTIAQESDRRYLAQVTNPLLLPPWVVITRRAWDELPPDVRSRWQEVGNVVGWWYASGGRRADVLVLRKRFVISPLQTEAGR
jgi:4-amino-4-deoxy-L-arabinose transferase-like glycosyltransferase